MKTILNKLCKYFCIVYLIPSMLCVTSSYGMYSRRNIRAWGDHDEAARVRQDELIREDEALAHQLEHEEQERFLERQRQLREDEEYVAKNYAAELRQAEEQERLRQEQIRRAQEQQLRQAQEQERLRQEQIRQAQEQERLLREEFIRRQNQLREDEELARRLFFEEELREEQEKQLRLKRDEEMVRRAHEDQLRQAASLRPQTSEELRQSILQNAEDPIIQHILNEHSMPSYLERDPRAQRLVTNTDLGINLGNSSVTFVPCMLQVRSPEDHSNYCAYYSLNNAIELLRNSNNFFDRTNFIQRLSGWLSHLKRNWVLDERFDSLKPLLANRAHADRLKMMLVKLYVPGWQDAFRAIMSGAHLYDPTSLIYANLNETEFQNLIEGSPFREGIALINLDAQVHNAPSGLYPALQIASDFGGLYRITLKLVDDFMRQKTPSLTCILGVGGHWFAAQARWNTHHGIDLAIFDSLHPTYEYDEALFNNRCLREFIVQLQLFNH